MSSEKPNFIEEYFIDEKVCDDLIDLFHKTPLAKKGLYYTKKPGMVGSEPRIETDIKDSLDLGFSPSLIYNPYYSDEIIEMKTIHNNYMIALQSCLEQYFDKFQHILKPGVMIQCAEAVNLQYYQPGGGFKEYHSERQSNDNPLQISRVLVFMTYLNTVENGGTHFPYQDITTEAVKGKTVIWPTEWTHTHKGIVCDKEKYIMTGWYNYVNEMKLCYYNF